MKKITIFENYQNNGVELDNSDILSEVVAKFTSEYLFTSQTQINRLCETDLSLGKRIFNWIKSKFSSMGSATKEERQLKAFLKNAETLYQSAIRSAISKGAIGRAYLEQLDKNKTTAKEENNVQENTQAKQTTQENPAENIDKTNSEKYSVDNDKLINHQFPPYNESYSEANQIATRWAKQENVKEGWQKLVSYKGKWYKIEKFSDMDFGYLIVDKISNSKYNAELEELRKYEQNNHADSVIQEARKYENVRRNKSVDSTISNDGHSDRNIHTMAQNKRSGRESTINGKRNSGQGNRNKQKLSISDTDSQGNKLSEQQREFFKDSKVVDKDGNLLVVYHGTNAEFNIFDKSKNIEGNNAFWFSKSKEYAQEMAIVKNGKRVDSFYINLINPLIIEMNLKDFADNVKEKPYIQQALDNNNDGVIFKENAAVGDVFYAVFNSNQIKKITNKTPTKDADIRYSISDDYTENQYNDFGWVRANDVLTVNQMRDFTSKFISPTKEVLNNKTQNGELIIEVNNLKGEQFGVNNVLVFAKGKPENPKITKIIEINLDNETDIDNIRREIYAREKYRSRTSAIIDDLFFNGIVRGYRIEDFKDYQEYLSEKQNQRINGKKSQGTQNNDRELQNRTRSAGETGKTEIKGKLSLNDDIDELFDDKVSENQEQTTNNETDEQSTKNASEEQAINIDVDEVKDTSHMQGQTKNTDAVKYRARLNQEKVYSKTELDELFDNTVNKIPDMRLDSKSQERAVEHLFEKILA